jgi:hypothetical protein
MVKMSPTTGFEGFDLSTFIQRLLIFDRYILHTHRLREIQVLIEKFGYDPVKTLLKSRSIKLLFGAVFFMHFDNEAPHFIDDGNGMTRIGSFHFGIGRLDAKDAVSRELPSLNKISGLNQRQVIKLKESIGAKLVYYDKTVGDVSLGQFNDDLARNAYITNVLSAVATVTGWITNRRIDPHSFVLRTVQIGPSTYEIITNIHTVHALSQQDTIRALKGGLLMIGELNRLIENMNIFQAMTAIRDEELPLLQEKLSFLANQINPEFQLQRFQRVLRIVGFPDLDEPRSEKVDLEKLLEIRESRECKEFRTWLWNAGEATDEEIYDQFSGLRNKLSLWAHGNVGKSLRWAGSTGIGLIPVVGNVTSAVLGLLDSFLLERLLPQSGPVIFLNKQYPSLFSE